jgi:hypothetical protein
MYTLLFTHVKVTIPINLAIPADYAYMALHITMVKVQLQNKIKLYTMIYIRNVHTIYKLGTRRVLELHGIQHHQG